jgi:BMFP domain-containing protein YqiC
MTTPSEPSDPTPADQPASAIEELRERLRPRSMQGAGATGSERLALERVQALELAVTSAQQRERDLLELSVRDGNAIVRLQAQVGELGERAARTEAAERSVFEAETRAETATRRAELMDGELMSTRSEIDRLRSRVVELEASLRRALSEIGEASIAPPPPSAAVEEAARIEESAQRSLELADRLRIKVIDLESTLRAVVAEPGDATLIQLHDEESIEGESSAASASAQAEERLADLEDRLAALDARIAELSGTMAPPAGDLVVDIPDAEDEAAVEVPAPPSEPVKPPASRWSDWRTT